MSTALRSLAGIILVAGVIRRWCKRGFGATDTERALALPGDAVVDDAAVVLTHAVSIRAHAAKIWPWLAQMGYGRGGWYTPPWVDTMWGVSNPSARHIVESLQDVARGDVILDGPPGTATFTVLECEPPTTLVLHSDRHPIHGRPPTAKTAPGLEFTWTFHVVADGPGSRLLIRTRGRARPWWVSVAARAVFAPIDYYMAASMLRAIKRRVEGA